MTTTTCSGKPGHRCSIQHRMLIDDYRTARLNDELRREQVAGVYGEGSPEWIEASQGMITFKSWLINMRGSNNGYED